MEVVGHQRGGGVRRGHELLAELNVLDCVASLVFDEDASGIDALRCEVLFHAFAFGEGLTFTFAAGDDAEGGFVFFQVVDGRVEAVFENGAGAVFADLGSENDQVIEAFRSAAAEAAQNKSLTDEKENYHGGCGCEKECSRYFGQFIEEADPDEEAHEKETGAQGEPDGVEHGAAADQEDRDAVQDAKYSDYHE